MKITFVGHSSLKISESLSRNLSLLLKKSIETNDIVTFYCGGYGAFDNLCANTCHALKNHYSNFEVIFVTPYMTSYPKLNNILDSDLYDSTIYPPIENTPMRYAISKRNEWMILNSDIVVAYVNRSYGGAYKTLQFAYRNQKKIINLADDDFMPFNFDLSVSCVEVAATGEDA